MTDEVTQKDMVMTSAMWENFAHEAGHAVVGHFAGLNLEYIEVSQRGTDEGNGVAVFTHADPKEERSAIMYAAGGPAVAELQQRFKKYRDRAKWVGDVEDVGHVNIQWPDLSDDDRRNLRNYLAANYYSGSANVKRETARIQNEARRQVRQYWPWIACVIDALADATRYGQDEDRARIDRPAFLKAIADADKLELSTDD